ncbi:MAG: hypothetical protein ABGW77_01165 [Campylobacterales bacterium]
MGYYKKSETIFSHLTLIFSLVAILGSLFFYQFFQQVNLEYQKELVDRSSVVVVSDAPIKEPPLPQYISAVIPIDPAPQIERIKEEFKGIDFSKIHLPYFYRLKIKGLASPRFLEYLKEQLMKNPHIKRVLTFTSTQEKIFNLITIIHYISKAFMWSSLILGFMLIVKQLEVWKLRHGEQIYIMELFGAPFWLKGATIFRIAFVDTFIAIGIVGIGSILLLNSTPIQMLKEQMGIQLHFSVVGEMAFLILVGLLISLSSTLIVIRGEQE